MLGCHPDGIMVRTIAPVDGIKGIAIAPDRRNLDNRIEMLDSLSSEGAKIIKYLEEPSEKFKTAFEWKGTDVTLP
jgi:hypothetical protein